MAFLNAWSSLAGRQAGETDCSWRTGWRIDQDQLVWKHNALSLAQETNIYVRRKVELQFARMTANHEKIFIPPFANHGRIWIVHALICTSLDLIMIINKEIIIHQKGDCLFSFVNLIAGSLNQSSIIEFGTTYTRCSLHSNNGREQLISQCLSSTWGVLYDVVVVTVCLSDNTVGGFFKSIF